MKRHRSAFAKATADKSAGNSARATEDGGQRIIAIGKTDRDGMRVVFDTMSPAGKAAAQRVFGDSKTRADGPRRLPTREG
jgi:hypothetical protein